MTVIDTHDILITLTLNPIQSLLHALDSLSESSNEQCSSLEIAQLIHLSDHQFVALKDHHDASREGWPNVYLLAYPSLARTEYQQVLLINALLILMPSPSTDPSANLKSTISSRNSTIKLLILCNKILLRILAQPHRKLAKLFLEPLYRSSIHVRLGREFRHVDCSFTALVLTFHTKRILINTYQVTSPNAPPHNNHRAPFPPTQQAVPIPTTSSQPLAALFQTCTARSLVSSSQNTLLRPCRILRGCLLRRCRGGGFVFLH